MIAEAQSYADNNTAFKDRGGVIRNGVSYSYGGNNKLDQYIKSATTTHQCPTNYGKH